MKSILSIVIICVSWFPFITLASPTILYLLQVVTSKLLCCHVGSGYFVTVPLLYNCAIYGYERFVCVKTDSRFIIELILFHIIIFIAYNPTLKISCGLSFVVEIDFMRSDFVVLDESRILNFDIFNSSLLLILLTLETELNNAELLCSKYQITKIKNYCYSIRSCSGYWKVILFE